MSVSMTSIRLDKELADEAARTQQTTNHPNAVIYEVIGMSLTLPQIEAELFSLEDRKSVV